MGGVVKTNRRFGFTRKEKLHMPANIAILVDAENVDPSFANQIFSYARSLGEVTIREIYGAGIALNEWADPILENTIHTNFTLRPNKYKNSSDIALTIGAMELLRISQTSEDKKVDAVIIASSDSDFSPLAFHLRAAGIDVIGMGEPGRINPMWPKACIWKHNTQRGLCWSPAKMAPFGYLFDPLPVVIRNNSLSPINSLPSLMNISPPPKKKRQMNSPAKDSPPSMKRNHRLLTNHGLLLSKRGFHPDTQTWSPPFSPRARTSYPPIMGLQKPSGGNRGANIIG